MKLSDIPAAIEGIGTELRLAARRLELRNLLKSHEDNLRYDVQNDRDDTGVRETVWSMCGCSYCRRTGAVERCAVYLKAEKGLAEMES